MKSFVEYKESLSESTNQPDKEAWTKWKKLVNMSSKELKEFYESDDGKNATDKDGIDTGRESARMLFKMIPDGKTFDDAQKNWTSEMWLWCKKQIAFINRTKSMRHRMVGNPFERDGKKTRWHKSLLIWGHDPKKK